MELYYSFSILIVLTALFSYLNLRLLKLPSTIGIMIIAMIASITLVALGKTYPSLFAQFSSLVAEVDLSKVLMGAMLNFLLFVISVAERIPVKFFQHMTGTDGLYEVRIEYQGNIYRIFSCFDEGNLVVLFNGFQKKSQKTPTGEIEKALKIKTEYFIEKVKSKGHGNKK